MELKKAQLVKLDDDSLSLIPLEEIKNGFFDFNNCDKNCEYIKIDPPKINLWVYRSYSGIDCMANENHIASLPTPQELATILDDNKGICFIKVTSSNEIASPSNGLGNRAVVIHLSKELEETSISA